MRKVFIPLLLFLGITLQATAQQAKDIMKAPIPVAMFQATYAFHFPGLDNKTLYGVSHNVGGGFSFKTAALGDLITLNMKANSGAWFRKFDTSMPTLLISGTDDPVGSYGEGVGKVYRKLSGRGANVTLRLVQGERHELLNEKDSEETIREILEFIGRR